MNQAAISTPLVPMARGGTAVVKKVEKYVLVDSDGEEVSASSDHSSEDATPTKSHQTHQVAFNAPDENADPAATRDRLKLSITGGRRDQPRQEMAVEQSAVVCWGPFTST
jgi:hypothetical protein